MAVGEMEWVSRWRNMGEARRKRHKRLKRVKEWMNVGRME